jgi:hypothetical protein
MVKQPHKHKAPQLSDINYNDFVDSFDYMFNVNDNESESVNQTLRLIAG